jgi:hypothetical protein
MCMCMCMCMRMCMRMCICTHADMHMHACARVQGCLASRFGCTRAAHTHGLACATHARMHATVHVLRTCVHMHVLHGHAHALATWACTCACTGTRRARACVPDLYVCMHRSYAAHRARQPVPHARLLAEAAAAAAAPPRCLGVIHSGGWAVIGGGLVRLPAAPPRCLPWPYRPYRRTIYIYISWPYRPTMRTSSSVLDAACLLLTSHTLAHLLALLACSTLAHTCSTLALHLLYT